MRTLLNLCIKAEMVAVSVFVKLLYLLASTDGLK